MLRYFLMLMVPLCSCAGELPFQSLTFEAAQQQAAAEQKLIFLAFHSAGRVDQVAKHAFIRSADTRAWLNDHTVALLIDADAQPELARKYEIRVYPGFILLDAGGQVRYRYLSSCSPKQFLEDSANAGDAAHLVQVARDKLTADPKSPFLRYDLASKLLLLEQREESFQLIKQVMLEKRAGQHRNFPNFRLYQQLLACHLAEAQSFLAEEFQVQADDLVLGRFDRSALDDFGLLAAMTGNEITAIHDRLVQANLPRKKRALFEEVFAEELRAAGSKPSSHP